MVHRHLELIQKVDLQQKDQVDLQENHRRIKKAIVVVKANFKFTSNTFQKHQYDSAP